MPSSSLSNKNKKSFKSNSVTISAKPLLSLSESSIKLTKQQKRDLRRKQLSMENKSNCTSATTRDEEVVKVKLTKQQGKDKKRNALSFSACVGTTSNTTATITAAANYSSSVYKRKTIYPPLFLDKSQFPPHLIPHNRFLTSEDDCFNPVMKACYQGFSYCPPESFSQSFHESFKESMQGLELEGKYQYDITQPAGLGTKTAKTFVTRCLVGDAGTTYKYLGLRMFSIPWEEGSVGSSQYSVEIGRLNLEMIKRSQALIADKKEAGSCQYNLTLINRCFPLQSTASELKDEPTFKQEKCAVSWHADSTLEHFSTIGVYHVTSRLPPCPPADSSCSEAPIQRKKKKTEKDGGVHEHTEVSTGSDSCRGSGSGSGHSGCDDDRDESWRIALRVSYDAEGPNVGRPSSRAQEMKSVVGGTSSGETLAPPIVFALPNKSAYFLLDDFNHHHQHAVLAGNSHRYASTHRVCRTDGHTFRSVKSHCTSVLQQKMVFTEKYLRALLNTANEIEFEWIRQYYIQGSKHRETHLWWESAIAELLHFWNEMRKKTILALEVLRDAAGIYVNVDVAGPAVINSAAAASENSANKLKKQRAKQLKRIESVESSSYTVVAQLLLERVEKRKDWHVRQSDSIFKTMAPEYRPVSPPLPPYDSAAEELILVPRSSMTSVANATDKKSGSTSAESAREKGSLEMISIDLARLCDEKILMKWQNLFDSNSN